MRLIAGHAHGNSLTKKSANAIFSVYIQDETALTHQMQGNDTDNTEDDFEPPSPDYSPQSPHYSPFDSIIFPSDSQLQDIQHLVEEGEIGENDTVVVWFNQYGQNTARVERMWMQDQVSKASILFRTGVTFECDACMLVRVKEEAY
jgi:hypothetical protein